MNFQLMLDDIYTNLESTESDTLVLPIPDLDKTPTRVVWKNIKEFLKLTKTPPDHLYDFIEKHSGKKINWFSESVSDGLIIHDKKFGNIEIIGIMKKYVKDYIICNICKKSNTLLYKDQQLRKYKIKCSDCNSDYTV